MTGFWLDFEALEDEATGPFFADNDKPGRFVREPWERTNADGTSGGGGMMSMIWARTGKSRRTCLGQFTASSPEFRSEYPQVHQKIPAFGHQVFH